MSGHPRYKDGAWRLTAEAGKDALGKRRQIHATVHAPNNRAGRRKADIELAALVLKGAKMAAQTSDSSTTLASYLDGYVDRRKGDWAPSTRNLDPGIIRRHIIPHLGHLTLEDLRRRHIAAWHTELTKRGCAPASVGKYHRILHRALADAVDLELLVANPAANMKAPKVDKGNKRAPTDDELDAILSAITDPQFLTIVCVDAIIGSRRGEVCALRWSDIDLDGGSMRITRAMSNGGKEEGLVERQTKTGAKAVKMLDPGTVAELRAHRVRRLEQCMAVGARMDDGGFVFTPAEDPTGRRPLPPHRITAMFTYVRKRADVEGVTFHDLRRYVASHLLDDGVDIETAADWLGHSAKMLLDTYGAPVHKDRRAAESMARRRNRTKATG